MGAQAGKRGAERGPMPRKLPHGPKQDTIGSRNAQRGARSAIEHLDCEDPRNVIPDIVHQIWLGPGDQRMMWESIVSMVLVLLVVQPQRHIVWYDGAISRNPAFAEAWDCAAAIANTTSEVTPPSTVFGRSIKWPAHRSDVLRLDTLLQHGGVRSFPATFRARALSGPRRASADLPRPRRFRRALTAADPTVVPRSSRGGAGNSVHRRPGDGQGRLHRRPPPQRAPDHAAARQGERVEHCGLEGGAPKGRRGDAGALASQL